MSLNKKQKGIRDLFRGLVGNKKPTPIEKLPTEPTEPTEEQNNRYFDMYKEGTGQTHVKDKRPMKPIQKLPEQSKVEPQQNLEQSKPIQPYPSKDNLEEIQNLIDSREILSDENFSKIEEYFDNSISTIKRNRAVLSNMLKKPMDAKQKILFDKMVMEAELYQQEVINIHQKLAQRNQGKPK